VAAIRSAPWLGQSYVLAALSVHNMAAWQSRCGPMRRTTAHPRTTVSEIAFAINKVLDYSCDEVIVPRPASDDIDDNS